MRITQAWHTATVTLLMMQARGDLILDQRGDLCYRKTYDSVTWRDIPWEQHGIGEKLAIIDREGWTLTRNGAQFILENCPPDRASDIRKLEELAQNRALAW